MFSVTAEYALRAVVYLALHDNAPATGRQIAESTRSPVRYMSRVLRDLTNAGLLHAYRGPSGGFELSRAASSISILEVVNVVHPIKRIISCPLGIPSHGENLCRLHRRLDESIASLEQVLSTSFITDLLPPTEGGTVPVTSIADAETPHPLHQVG
ncbi:MAG: Rrf2 family transcriptional regulator [Phycisphaerales bacterium]|nr:Rrf2 family transcriptional regulator [Phycisphaerales bacterium]